MCSMCGSYIGPRTRAQPTAKTPKIHPAHVETPRAAPSLTDPELDLPRDERPTCDEISSYVECLVTDVF